MKMPSIQLREYLYDLPEKQIAQYPLQQRDSSKLLVYDQGEIRHAHFYQIVEHLPPNSLLFFNDTKVIPARLYFEKETGAKIEIFLLSPINNSAAEIMYKKEECVWNCMIGNLRKWKSDIILEKKINQNQALTLHAELVDRDQQLVRFFWQPSTLTFSEVLTETGNIPLPPYVKRSTVSEDAIRYQTVFSKHEGAVAAPTAGLHFTNEILENLEKKGYKKAYLTLHVGAGTFQSIKTQDVTQHTMHCEPFSITKTALIQALSHNERITAVGTTSLRTLESLYWIGAKLLLNKPNPFHIEKLIAYQYEESKMLPSTQQALQAIINWMGNHQQETITASTEIFIFPGYQFKICNALITNFHMPGSTLILLIAAWTGQDWKKIYASALKNNYRFLSYGDSSLLLPKKNG